MMRKTTYAILTMICGIILLLIGCYIAVVCNASCRTFEKVEDVPHNKMGLLLATSPITPGGGHNFYFDNRI